MSVLENIVLGALVLLILLWFGPGIKASIEQSKQATADWPSVLLPIGFVVMFVLFLIAMV